MKEIEKLLKKNGVTYFTPSQRLVQMPVDQDIPDKVFKVLIDQASEMYIHSGQLNVYIRDSFWHL